jgi:hypothetical protein
MRIEGLDSESRIQKTKASFKRDALEIRRPSAHEETVIEILGSPSDVCSGKRNVEEAPSAELSLSTP